MSEMHNPPHPGLILRDDVLPELGLTVSDAAAQLGVARVTLSRVINGRTAISAEMALRLAKWLNGDPEIWLRMQVTHDLWHARKGAKSRLVRIKPIDARPFV